MCKQPHEQQQQDVSPTRNGHPEKLRTQQLKSIFIANYVFMATNHMKVSCLCQLRRPISLKINHRPVFLRMKSRYGKILKNDKSVDTLISMGVWVNSTIAPITLFSYSPHNSMEKGPSWEAVCPRPFKKCPTFYSSSKFITAFIRLPIHTIRTYIYMYILLLTYALTHRAQIYGEKKFIYYCENCPFHSLLMLNSSQQKKQT